MPDTPSDPQDNAQRKLQQPVGATGTGLKPAYDASWAVVVGIDNYQHLNKLKYAVGDAAGMAALLIDQLGFRRDKVLVLLDPPPAGDLPFDLVSGEASKAAIEELLFTRLPKLVNRPDLTGYDDRVVIFYAGHGESWELDGRQEGYLIPATGEPGQWHTFIAMDAILKVGERLRAKHVFYLLDACFSGLATARSGAAPTRYQAGMLATRARQVLTAGTARQAVADAGPGGHSLFTGYVLNGLRGDAAQAGATAITASDLMVYVKNRVGQAGDSQQTPDFGSLPGHESGGDFVFVLPPEDDTYEQAVVALGQGQIASFRSHTARAMENRPQSAETLYLQYRHHLLDNDIDGAIDCIRQLQQADRTRSKIPLSDYDLQELATVLPFWQPVLQMSEGSPPVTVNLWAGPDANSLALVVPDAIEVSTAVSSPLYSVPAQGVAEWHVVNQDTRPLHIYYIQFAFDGRLEVGPLLNRTEAILREGLKPGQEERSGRFELAARPELVETRIFAASDSFKKMSIPPTARAIMTFDESALKNALKKLESFQRSTTIWYRTVVAA